MMTREQAAACVSAEFEGKPVDVPYVGWFAACPDLRPSMPLSDFLRLMPNWLLEMTTDEDDGLKSASYLAVAFESLWDAEGKVYFEDDDSIADLVGAFRCACHMEQQRRWGLVRWTAEAPDRLQAGRTLRVQMNPATLEFGRSAVSIGRPDDPDLDLDRVRDIMAQSIAAAAVTDWPDVVLRDGP